MVIWIASIYFMYQKQASKFAYHINIVILATPLLLEWRLVL